MTDAELDLLWKRSARTIVSAEITSASSGSPTAARGEDRRVIARLNDGAQVELFSLQADDESFIVEALVGLTVDKARLKVRSRIGARAACTMTVVSAERSRASSPGEPSRRLSRATSPSTP
jgi:hypothetical protein